MSEHRRRWRAGYVILPIAVVVALLQISFPSDYDPVGWLGVRHQQVSASDASSSTVERAAEAPQTERQPPPESIRRSDAPPSPLPNHKTLGSSNGAADEVTRSVAPPAIRVFIHHAAGTWNALPAIQLAGYLQTRGFAVTGIRPVDVPIERPSVRYFFAGDQPATRRLVEAIGAFFTEVPGRAPDEAADFSHISPKPRGNVEVWLPAPAAGERHS